MNIYLDIISLVFIVVGCVVMALSALGLYRFPDIYMRLHSSTKINTGGAMNILLGLIIRTGLHHLSVKLLVLLLLIFILTPVVSHAIARSAHLKGDTPIVPFSSHSKEQKKPKHLWRRT